MKKKKQSEQIVFRSFYTKHKILRLAYQHYDYHTKQVKILFVFSATFVISLIFLNVFHLSSLAASKNQETSMAEKNSSNLEVFEPFPTTRYITPASSVENVFTNSQLSVETPSYQFPLAAFPRITTFFSKSHPGIDLAAPTGTYVYAATDGEIQIAGWWQYGITVVLKQTNTSWTTYGHLFSVHVQKGQYVQKGTIIGKVGCTGRCTGAHLHFEIYQNGYAANPKTALGF